jgi:hypothetical protein
MIDIPSASLALVGDVDNQAAIERELRSRNFRRNVAFKGYIEDINAALATFDVFAYPLNPRHYGTTENALLEAMAAGLPVVVLNQSAEKYLVKHMETGLLADNEEQFAEHIRYLYDNPGERARLGDNARRRVLRELSLEKTVAKLHDCYSEVMKSDRKPFDFLGVFGQAPHDWVAACLGSYASFFGSEGNGAGVVLDKIIRLPLTDRSKSSIRHFSRYYPQDQVLKGWKEIVS